MYMDWKADNNKGWDRTQRDINVCIYQTEYKIIVYLKLSDCEINKKASD